MLGQTALVPILSEPLLASATLTAVYWIALVVGGGMVALSVLSGDSGHSDFHLDSDATFDFHTDGDFDAAAVHFDPTGVDFDASGADLDVSGADFDPAGGDMTLSHDALPHGAETAHAAALSHWLSMRFVVFFLAMFGATGVIVTYVTSASAGAALAIALVGGAIIGQGAHQIFAFVRASSGNTATRPQDYVHKLARVTIPIRGVHAGEIALQVRGTERRVPAVASGTQVDFDAGEEVVAVGYRGGVASVISRSEAEQQMQAARSAAS